MARIYRTIQKRSLRPRQPWWYGHSSRARDPRVQSQVALRKLYRKQGSVGDRIPAELFQILKDDVKVLHSICQQVWKTQQGPQDWKRSVFIPIPKKGNTKECSNYHTTALISHVSKVTLKILQARFQQYMNWELQMYKLGLQKAEEPEIKLPTFIGSQRKQMSSRHMSTSPSLTMLKPLTVCITTNYGKFLKRWEYQTPWPTSWEICMQLRNNSENQTWNKWLVQNRERSTARLYIVTLLIWFICRLHHVKCWTGWSASWNQDCQEKYQWPQICRWYHSNGRKYKWTKDPLGEDERSEWKSWLKI